MIQVKKFGALLIVVNWLFMSYTRKSTPVSSARLFSAGANFSVLFCCISPYVLFISVSVFTVSLVRISQGILFNQGSSPEFSASLASPQFIISHKGRFSLLMVAEDGFCFMKTPRSEDCATMESFTSSELLGRKRAAKTSFTNARRSLIVLSENEIGVDKEILKELGSLREALNGL